MKTIITKIHIIDTSHMKFYKSVKNIVALTYQMLNKTTIPKKQVFNNCNM